MEISTYESLLYRSDEITVNFKYLYDYNKEYLSFLLSIETEKFVGKQEFYLNIDYVAQLIIKIDEVYELKHGEILLNDSNSESFILVLVDEYETVKLQGRIGNVFDFIHMDFDVNVDQTILGILKNTLVESINLVKIP